MKIPAIDDLISVVDAEIEGARAFWMQDATPAMNPHVLNKPGERLAWTYGWRAAHTAYCAGEKNPFHDGPDE